jgi:tRNA 5-methylaminomethyl-2-thiouridine biosynthesis bifunctional protein
MTVRHVVLDTAFGDGARFAAARAAGHPQLHYLAITPRVAAAASIPDPQLRGLWPPDLPGFHRIVLDDGRVTLDLLVGEVPAVLPQIVARVDHFHVHGAHAGMARTLARLAAPGATLDALATDDASVWSLTAAGFVCRLADGDKGDAITAITAITATYRGRRTPPVQPMPAAAPARRAVVIGAGLAGAAVCRRLCASGWNVTLIERHAQPAQEASGNLAGIFMPLLSRDDNIPTRLARAAYLFALREWRRLGGVGTAFTGADCGVLQLARDAGHARVQQAVLDAWHYPPAYVRWADAQEAGRLLGGATPHGGWLFPQGGWARPSSLCAAMLDSCGARLTRVFHSAALALHRADDGSEEWLVHGAEGALLARAPTVILANGAGAVAIGQAAQLPLQALRGQVTHLAVDAGAPQLPLVVCREAYVTPACDGIVCAGATYDNDGDPQLRPESQRENLERLAEIVPGPQVAALAHSAPLAGRVGFRCAAPDRLPLAGALPDYPAAGRLEQLADVPRHAGLYGLLGYASRGLIWAPLMAELLVSQLDNTPPPLEAMLVDALDPGRFLLKQRRRAQ